MFYTCLGLPEIAVIRSFVFSNFSTLMKVITILAMCNNTVDEIITHQTVQRIFGNVKQDHLLLAESAKNCALFYVC